jgi:hypothetical protein
MIKSFGSLYAGHVDFPDLGFDATPVGCLRSSSTLFIARLRQ